MVTALILSWVFFSVVLIGAAISRGCTRAVALLDALIDPEEAKAEICRRRGWAKYTPKMVDQLIRNERIERGLPL